MNRSLRPIVTPVFYNVNVVLIFFWVRKPVTRDVDVGNIIVACGATNEVGHEFKDDKLGMSSLDL